VAPLPDPAPRARQSKREHTFPLDIGTNPPSAILPRLNCRSFFLPVSSPRSGPLFSVMSAGKHATDADRFLDRCGWGPRVFHVNLLPSFEKAKGVMVGQGTGRPSSRGKTFLTGGSRRGGDVSLFNDVEPPDPWDLPVASAGSPPGEGKTERRNS